MNPLIAWWFRKLVSFTLVIDRMNEREPKPDMFITFASEGIRLIAKEAAAYADGDNEDTQPLGGLSEYISDREAS